MTGYKCFSRNIHGRIAAIRPSKHSHHSSLHSSLHSLAEHDSQFIYAVSIHIYIFPLKLQTIAASLNRISVFGGEKLQYFGGSVFLKVSDQLFQRVRPSVILLEKGALLNYCPSTGLIFPGIIIFTQLHCFSSITTKSLSLLFPSLLDCSTPISSIRPRDNVDDGRC